MTLYTSTNSIIACLNYPMFDFNHNIDITLFSTTEYGDIYDISTYYEGNITYVYSATYSLYLY